LSFSIYRIITFLNLTPLIPLSLTRRGGSGTKYSLRRRVKMPRVGFCLPILVLSLAGTLLIGCTPKPTGEITIKQTGGAGMLIADCADSSYISNTADYIIEGTVERVESRWNEDKTSIFTYTDLAIDKYVKGIPFAEDRLQIVTPGGTVGEVSQWVEDQPIFHEGKRVRIYFQEINGEFSIVCGSFGVEEI
jgi:hypothetical protein